MDSDKDDDKAEEEEVSKREEEKVEISIPLVSLALPFGPFGVTVCCCS